MKSLTTLAAAAVMAAGTSAFAAALPSTSATTTYHRAHVHGVGVFYREAGLKDGPTIVLLHGFPSSSRMFDTIIPLLATRCHLIAPDYPGFGQSDAPPRNEYRYKFDHLAETTKSVVRAA
jgi:pimeloyl-ACP methyl ester carboxylesterase